MEFEAGDCPHDNITFLGVQMDADNFPVILLNCEDCGSTLTWNEIYKTDTKKGETNER